jgi:hypothetical protein
MMIEIIRMLDALICVFGFSAGIAYAYKGEWVKAAFFMALATNCEVGYWMAE